MGKHGPADNSDSQKKKKKSINPNAIIAVVLILVGLGVLLYPVAATQWNNFNQSQAAKEYAKLEKQVPPEALNTAWEEAQEYNRQLGQVQVTDAWTTTTDEDSPEYQRYRQYLSVLSETDAMGRIVIPSIDSDLPIYHGTSEKSLSRGAGHLFGTDLPVGGVGEGEGRHASLSAHRGLQNSTLWDNLPDVKKGDAFYIMVSGEKLKYEVHDIQVVEPSETSHLTRQPGEDLVTLITCTPYGINTHRLLVTGHQVPMDPAEESVFNGTKTKWQWWMWAILAAAALVLILLILWWRKYVGGNKDDADALSDDPQ
ncbi:class C sortase [Corynebacterium singulare]|uniref:Sortase family protein, LPXTG-site transpeptidase n=1 Tax=Corynebacterium singulare TaxID=161899 RepID=A0A0B6ETV3_9CORY|nr:class C sortase [Corynebacterium singulare]AJI79932.1 sortase family protein, LPXTG-site transpeptidase [Corynebacterium singulare]